ncbi:hypothetical protein DTL42_19910 [Bremerella cremea]|uniref:Type II/III secretion system secretin-like domain-containing protein n=1 Tax=Bremerella cremea TaxID=1031537 RepID=A0A368KLM7_9BACT|nr:hypothetical protein [Bremerella cremea]RCS42097.1 hypothetical protein DTL42_19910 [Bremerella cremea]
MRKLLIISLLLVSTLGGIGLAVFLESCDLSQWHLPAFLAQATPSVSLETTAEAEVTSVESVPPTPPVAVTPATPVTIAPVTTIPSPEPVPAPIQVALEPAVTQQFSQTPNPNNQQDRQWELLNKAFDTVKEVATHKADNPQQPPQPAIPEVVQPVPPPLDPIPAQPVPEPIETPRSSQPRIIPDEGDDRLTIVIQDSDIREVLEMLSEHGQLNILPSQNVQGQVSASLTKVDVPTALAAILKSTGYVMLEEDGFIYVGTPADMQSMSRLSDQLGTRIYKLKYIRAEDVQKLITPMLSETVGMISISAPTKTGIAADSTSSGSDDYAGLETVFVRDYEQVLKKIDRAILEIDCRPLQVAIEAMIMSVKLDDSLDMGVSFEALRGNDNIRLISGYPLNNLASLSLTEGGLKLGYLDANLSLFVDALETIGETNVIAAPQLLVLNKQRAEILIGQQKGYISTTVTESASTQTVEFLDVGTQLRIRPFITNDGMVRLEVHPEISTGEVRVEEGMTIPDKDVTQVTTNIMCPDGRTVVLGGLIKSGQIKKGTQIPLLGSLPGVGVLFRQKNEDLQREELIVLITPRIVDPNHIPQDGENARELFEIQHEYSADKMSPLSKRHIARNYYRLATSAWATGDALSALRYVNLSIHYDALNLEAVNLRETIVGETGLGDRTVHSHLKEGLYPWQHPHGVAVSPWHLNQGGTLPAVEQVVTPPPKHVVNPRIKNH